MCRSIGIGLFLGIGIGLKEPILFQKYLKSKNKQNNEDDANFYHFSRFCCREAKICLFNEK